MHGREIDYSRLPWYETMPAGGAPAVERPYRFGHAELRPVERELRIDGEAVAIGGRAFDLLQTLIDRRDRIVTKDELFALVWPGLVVEEHNLYVQVNTLRKLLGPRVIVTVAGRGYRFGFSLDDDHAGVGAPPDASPPGGAAGSAGDPAAAHSAHRPVIAVLPFDDSSPMRDTEFIARGLAENLVLALARNTDVRVVSHHASFAAAEQRGPLTNIAARLAARYLIGGSVRRDADSLRIDIQLIDGLDGAIQWTDTYFAASGDLPALQAALVQRIAGPLHSKARHGLLKGAAARAPKHLDVFAMTLRAVALIFRFTAPAFHEARGLFEKALAMDPDYAAAWAYLAMLNLVDASLRITGQWDDSRYVEYVAQAQRSLALDGDDPAPYRVLSYAASMAHEFDKAVALAKRAVELAPLNADALHTLAQAQLGAGALEEALRSIEQAFVFHPQPPPWQQHVYAAALWANGRLEEALRANDECRLRVPQLWPARFIRVYILAELGRPAEARQEGAALRADFPLLSAALVQQRQTDVAGVPWERRRAALHAAGID
jgi:TolB-like protein/DNA-binding winged helix-turn-helix (wHTH) protein